MPLDLRQIVVPMAVTQVLVRFRSLVELLLFVLLQLVALVEMQKLEESELALLAPVAAAERKALGLATMVALE
jgi:hypothetical protein